mmetsp:Transcript_77407/g.134049  ORF Transcript_77407/g.134049 Transcript_77407/m.134049 type:complete len:412 (-) Transcript_77407:30-1265(-)
MIVEIGLQQMQIEGADPEIKGARRRSPQRKGRERRKGRKRKKGREIRIETGREKGRRRKKKRSPRKEKSQRTGLHVDLAPATVAAMAVTARWHVEADRDAAAPEGADPRTPLGRKRREPGDPSVTKGGIQSVHLPVLQQNEVPKIVDVLLPVHHQNVVPKPVDVVLLVPRQNVAPEVADAPLPALRQSVVPKQAGVPLPALHPSVAAGPQSGAHQKELHVAPSSAKLRSGSHRALRPGREPSAPRPVLSASRHADGVARRAPHRRSVMIEGGVTRVRHRRGNKIRRGVPRQKSVELTAPRIAGVAQRRENGRTAQSHRGRSDGAAAPAAPLVLHLPRHLPRGKAKRLRKRSRRKRLRLRKRSNGILALPALQADQQRRREEFLLQAISRGGKQSAVCCELGISGKQQCWKN